MAPVIVRILFGLNVGFAASGLGVCDFWEGFISIMRKVTEGWRKAAIDAHVMMTCEKETRKMGTNLEMMAKLLIFRKWMVGAVHRMKNMQLGY